MPPIGRHISKLSDYAPALPTPFGKGGSIDTAAFEEFCHCQIRRGATALVVGGTTGEAPTLVEVTDSTNAEVEAAMARLCEDHADYVVEILSEPGQKRVRAIAS
jgi:dihydrodipicolinate synthase/N-acetylneuraminate lyase